MESSEGSLRVGLASLLVAMLIVGDPFRGLLVDRRAGCWRQALGIDPRAGGLADLFDRQVQGVGRFFL